MEQIPLFVRGNVSEEVQGDDGVERARPNLEVECVRAHEARLGDVVTCQLDLHRRDVDAGDAMAAGQLARARHAAAAPQLEHVGVVGKPRVEVAEPLERR